MPTRNKMINEAIARMMKLNIHTNTIENLKNGTVNVSKQRGCLYWANETEQEQIVKFERATKALVYHAILTPTQYGRLFSMLFVSQYEEEWTLDNQDIKNGTPLAMVINLDDEWCSDMGGIVIRQLFGGLVRIA